MIGAAVGLVRSGVLDQLDGQVSFIGSSRGGVLELEYP